MKAMNPKTQDDGIHFLGFNSETRDLLDKARATIRRHLDRSDILSLDVNEYRALVRRAQDELNAHDFVRKFCFANQQTLEPLLGGPMSFQAIVYLRAVRPVTKAMGVQENIGFHRESFFGPDFKYSYNVWIPLANIDAKNTLFYVPGSGAIPDEEIMIRKRSSPDVQRYSDAHKIGLLYDEIEIVSGVNLQKAVRMPVPVEQWVLFPSPLIHGNGSNDSQNIRISLDFRVIRTNQILENKGNYAAGGAYFTDFATKPVERLAWINREIPSSCDVSVYIPCLNEEKDVAASMETIMGVCEELGLSYELLVVDDASQDATIREAQKIQKKYPEKNIRVFSNVKRRGLARNFVDAAYVATGRHYMLVCGDSAEPPESYRAILSRLGRADMIIPVFKEKDQRKWGRRNLSKTFTRIVNWISGNDIAYYNGPTLHRRANVMRWHADTDCFAYQAEIITRMIQEGATYEQVVVENRDREHGSSTAVSLKNFLGVTHSLVQIGLRRLRHYLFQGS